MTLRNIGEFRLIDELTKKIRVDRSVVLGIGDDAAVLKIHPQKDILFTTDMLIENRHFRLNKASAYEIGWKALAVNLSDIAAMGGLPTHAVVSVGLPPKLSLAFVKDLYRGLEALARKFHVNLVGGDTNSAERLVISVALLGEAPKNAFVKRSGAKVGDVIFVSGPLGGSYASKKHLHFTPRIKESQFLVRYFKLSAMMDISDGLASDIHRLTQASRVGAYLSVDSIPCNKGVSLAQVLNDGEDFELLFTLSPKEAAKLSMNKSSKFEFYPIGKIVHKKLGVKLVQLDGTSKLLPEKGYDHFRC